MKPYLPKYYLGLVFLFFTGLTALAFPKLLGSLVDAVNGPVLWGLELNEVAFLLLIILVLQAVFSFFRVYLFTDVTESTLMHIRQKVYGHLLSLPMAYFSKESVGELSSRISSDITQLRETFRTTLAEFLRQFMIIIGGVILLAFTSPKLTGMILLIVPVVALSAVFFGRFIRSIARDVQDDIALSNKMVIEGLQGIANVKAFVNEQFEKFRYNKVTQAIQKKAVKGGLWSGSFASFIILCMVLATVWVIRLAGMPKADEVSIDFLDWSLIKISIPSKGIFNQKVDFESKTTQYKNLLKFAIRRKFAEGNLQSIEVGKSGEIGNQTYLSRIIDNINSIINEGEIQKLERRDLFTFVGEGKYRLRITPANISFDKGLLSEAKHTFTSPDYQLIFKDQS